MMHLSPMKLLLLLTLGLFLTLGVGLGMVWSQHVQIEAQQKQELSLAQLKLIKSLKDVQQVSGKLQTLQQTLAQMKSEAAPIRANLVRSLEMIEFNRSLFEIARVSGVEIITVALSPPVNTSYSGLSCLVLKASIRITGSQDNLLDFIHNWTQSYSTGVVVSVNLDYQTSGESPDAGEDEPLASSASMELLTYSYVGN
jgi:Tfp pilus assembly protein PilO